MVRLLQVSSSFRKSLRTQKYGTDPTAADAIHGGTSFEKKLLCTSRLLSGGGGKVDDTHALNGKVAQIHSHHLTELRPAAVVLLPFPVRVRRKDRVSFPTQDFG